MKLQLNQQQAKALFKVNEADRGKGGFQNLIINLQSRLDKNRLIIFLTEKDLNSISRYALNYKNGGWQTYLRSIFSDIIK
ncbi:hypothetical protein ACO2KH_18570 [Leptospira terpstrae]|uniref:hypothetical protein n=1 Tax=Leptospira terpstrae TaxID=293075 RepID=UPI003CFFC204